MSKKKHHSHQHQNIQSMSIAAHSVLNDYKKKVDAETEEIRKDYERQLLEKSNDDWLRNLSTSCLVYYEMTGDKQKTEKFATKLAEKLAKYFAEEKPTEDIVEELSRATDIILQISDTNIMKGVEENEG